MPGANAPVTVLFVCWGNTCRSVMAEAFAKRRLGRLAHFESVGLDPMSPVDAQAAIESLKYHFGITVEDHRPRGLDAVDVESYTYVVAMDREIATRLRRITGRELIVWRTKDPWKGDPIEYKACGLSILTQLMTLPFATSGGH